MALSGRHVERTSKAGRAEKEFTETHVSGLGPASIPSALERPTKLAEMHLLAVQPEYRGRGLGSRLIEAAVALTKRGGWKRMVLRTQPSMHAAQRLYEASGFARAPERNQHIVKISGRTFLVFERAL